MSNERIFQCKNHLELVESTKIWLIESGFNCQQLDVEDEKILLQVEKKGKWRLAVGMSTALNIIFDPIEDAVRVEMSTGRWLDKAGVATVSMFVLWPLAVTAGLGAWQQLKMPEKIYEHIAQFVEQQEFTKQYSSEINIIEKTVLKARNTAEENRDKEALENALKICDNLLFACRNLPEKTLYADLVYHRATVLWLSGDWELAKDELCTLVRDRKCGEIDPEKQPNIMEFAKDRFNKLAGKQNGEQVFMDPDLQAKIYDLLAEISTTQSKYDHALVFLSRAKNLGPDKVRRKISTSLREVEEKRATYLCEEPFNDRQIIFCTSEIPSWFTDEFCFANVDILRITKWKFGAGHPQTGVFYVCHPLRFDQYYALERFHDKVFEDKQAELVYLLQSIGANYVHVEAVKDDLANEVITSASQGNINDDLFMGISGGYSDGQLVEKYHLTKRSGVWDVELHPIDQPRIPEDLLWFYHEPAWQRVAQSALEKQYKNISLELRYQEDFSINSSRMTKIESDLEFFSQKTGIQWSKETEVRLQQRQNTIWKFTASFP